MKTPSTFTVTFWGTRGSIATPGANTERYGGNTPCVSVQHNNTTLILDAGTGIRALGMALADQTAPHNRRDHHILLSHTHWDHIQGLPFFKPAYLPETQLVIHGSPRRERFLEAILKDQMDETYFPVKMSDLPATIAIHEIDTPAFDIDDVHIAIAEQPCHPGGTVRFRLETGAKRIVYATDVELNALFASSRTSDNANTLAAQYRAFITDANLLIADGQYTEAEYRDKHGWGHTTIPLLLQIAHEQRVKQVAVFHHDPEHTDTMLDALAAQYKAEYDTASPPMQVVWAQEGMTLAL